MAAEAWSHNNGKKSSDGNLKQDATVGVELVTFMDPNLIKAAVKGEIDAFRDKTKHLHLQVTPSKNTVLHIHLSAARYRKTESLIESTDFVEQILDMCPSLIWQANRNGEILLHIAARHGHNKTVELLIERGKHLHEEELETGFGKAPQILMRMINKAKDTALHEAVRFNRFDVVKLLTREDPHFQYSANAAGETPLYLAAESGFNNLVIVILRNCTSPLHAGPNGKTALHAAVIRKNQAMTRNILKKDRENLSRAADEQGWIPLHYAAYVGDASMVKLLLKHDKYAAYIADRDGTTALHLAAHLGFIRVMKELISCCPDCCELVNKEGRNVLHFAVQSGKKAVNAILETKWLAKHLFEKDRGGITPLQQLAAYDSRIYNLEEHPGSNGDNSTEITEIVLNATFKSYKDGELEDTIKQVTKAKETHLLVATLIATVTFAAGFTVPGGYIGDNNPHQGSPILTRKAAFRAFVITDTIAMVLSSSSVFIYLFLALPVLNVKLLWYLLLAYWLTVFATGAMVVAFTTGLYAVLKHSSGLAIATCVIGCCFFPLPCYLYGRTICKRIRKWKNKRTFRNWVSDVA